MSKPLHAGKAAQNGLLAARLAARGFTSDTEILESDQGFAAVQSTSVNREAALAEPGQMCIRDSRLTFVFFVAHSFGTPPQRLL